MEMSRAYLPVVAGVDAINLGCTTTDFNGSAAETPENVAAKMQPDECFVYVYMNLLHIFVIRIRRFCYSRD